jgi:hypothetical protein
MDAYISIRDKLPVNDGYASITSPRISSDRAAVLSSTEFYFSKAISARINLYPYRCIHHQTEIPNEFRFASNNFEIENPGALFESFISITFTQHTLSKSRTCLTHFNQQLAST